MNTCSGAIQAKIEALQKNAERLEKKVSEEVARLEKCFKEDIVRTKYYWTEKQINTLKNLTAA